MSTTETGRPGRPSSNGCPTEVIPTVTQVPARRSILAAARAGAARTAQPAQPGPFADWRGQCPTEELTAVPAVHRRRPSRVSTSAKPTGSRSDRRERDRAAARRARARRHLRAAMAGILIAAALLGSLQLLALDGISSARQAALAEQSAAQHDASATATPAQPEQADAPAAQWTVEGTTAAAPSPLDLPRCTTSPDTPLPCLATISPDSRRAVVLEEDGSLTALVAR